MSEIRSTQNLQAEKYHVENLIDKTLDRLTFSQETVDYLSSELQSLYKQQKAIDARLNLYRGM